MKHFIYAIGDIHGCLEVFDRLWTKIEAHMNENPEALKTVVFLGDYIDRGPDSAGVIHRVIEMTSLLEKYDVKVVALKGNHEDMFQEYLDRRNNGSFLYNGGTETLRSYWDPLTDSVIIPDSHKEFLKNLRVYYNVGRFLFVHAGIDPTLSPEEQREHSMIWNRAWNNFDGEYQGGLFVVHGHTPVEDVVQKKNQLNIDTACVFGRSLTCVVIEENQEDDNFTFIQERNVLEG